MQTQTSPNSSKHPAAWVISAAILLFIPRTANADEFDDLCASAYQAAGRGETNEATRRYEQAARLLEPPPSSITYNIGTLYAQNGDLARAHSYLLQSLDNLDTAVSDPTRKALQNNLQLTQNKIRELAKAQGRTAYFHRGLWGEIKPYLPSSEACGFCAAIASGLLTGLLIFGAFRKAREPEPRWWKIAIAFAVVLVFGASFLPLANGFASHAIALDAATPIREQASSGAAILQTLQGGSILEVRDAGEVFTAVQAGDIRGYVLTESLQRL